MSDAATKDLAQDITQKWTSVQQYDLTLKSRAIGDLYSIREDLNHGSAACDQKILMNQCICHKLADGQLWIHLDLFPQSLLDHFVPREMVIDVLDYTFEASGLALFA